MLKVYVKITGSKQGPFMGEGAGTKWSAWIPALALASDLTAPRDQVTGQAAGKRQWGALKIVKAAGAASSQIVQAAATQEALSSVVIQFVTTSANGAEGVQRTVTLTNAAVRQVIRKRVPLWPPGVSRAAFHEEITLDVHGPVDTHELERVDLTFRELTFSYSGNKKSIMDDWSQ
jgi:type VI secretion system Hcp family effector